MELRQYWNVIWRRRWLVLAIIMVATLFSVYSFLTTPRTYELESVFTVRYPQAEANNADNGGTNDPQPPIVYVSDYKGYYFYLSSEYQVDDFTQIVETDAFGDAVLKTMQDRFSKNQIVVSDTVKFKSDLEKLRPMDIVDMIGADRSHRELRVFTVAPTRDLTKNIMDSIGIVLTESRYEPVRGKLDDRPIVAQFDMITYDQIKSSTSKEVTNTIVRIILGIVAALAIAFFLEYLDNSVRDERDARRVLDLPVIGAIPRA